MKILETQTALLSNAEVAAHLRATQIKSTKNPEYTKRDARPGQHAHAHAHGHAVSEVAVYAGRLRNLHFVIDDVSRYFKETDTGPQSNNGVEAAMGDKLAALVRRLKGYHLTKTELLMLVNLRPENIEQLEPLVEDVGERFSEGQQEGIVAAVGEVLGFRSSTGAGVGAGDGSGSDATAGVVGGNGPG